MSSEDTLGSTVGNFGKFQIWTMFLIGLGRYPIDFQLNNVVFVIPNIDYICLDEGTANATNICPCQYPEYDRSMIFSSVTSEWNLICEKKTLASIAQSMLQIGILFGSFAYGYISDRYGRKTGTVMAQFSSAVFVLISAVVPEFWMFLLCRFLIGTSVGGTMLCSYVLIIELSGKTFRPYLMGIYETSFVTAYIMLPIIAYFVREWRTLQLVTSVPWLLLVSYYWLMPESPRWLITVGRKKEAVAILNKMAKTNNRSTEDIVTIVDEIEKESLRENQTHGTYLDLFKTAKVRMYTIITAFVWMFCTHTFYGVNQYIGQLQGNLYINVLISALSFVPALVLVVVATLFLKRRASVVGSFSIAGLSLLVFIFTPKTMKWLTLMFAIIGQTAAYAAFVQIYLFTSEVFPTVVRNSAMGFSSVFGRFGGFIAPFVVNIGVEWGSIIIFSSVAFAAALLCFFLPETKDRVLLDSIEQTEKKPNKDLYQSN